MASSKKKTVKKPTRVSHTKPRRLGFTPVIFLLFFLSGVSSLIYEVLWTRQFVPVFGNSSYALSVVLAAFMAGLGIGGLGFGRLADRTQNRLQLYAFLEGGIAGTALLIPLCLHILGKIMPLVFSPLAEFTALINSVRFFLSFIILFIPASLIGGTLPVLGRHCIEELRLVGPRVSLLYGLNTLGAAAGCFLAGFVLIERMGLSGTNHLAVALNTLIMGTVLLYLLFSKKKKGELLYAQEIPAETEANAAELPVNNLQTNLRPFLWLTAFVTGCTFLAMEVLWVRYLALRLPSSPYSFTSILGVLLLGIASGSLVFRLLLFSRKNQASVLSFILIVSAPVILAMLVAASKIAVSRGIYFLPFSPKNPLSSLWEKLQSLNLALLTVFLPAVLLGMAFPALCTAFTQNIKKVGESLGKIYAANTAGSIVGSLLPIFLFIPSLGIRHSVIFFSLLPAAAGLGLVSFMKREKKILRAGKSLAALTVLGILSFLLVPKNLTNNLFLSTLQLGRHNRILFYKEGKTATSILVEDKVSGIKDLYINGIEEVPTSYAAQYCFKLMGSLGVLLHPNPANVLMICFGGGIAAGTTVQFPDVKTLTVVDIESSVIEAARYLTKENNQLLQSAKVKVVVEDGRNFLFMSRKKYPVIVSDSTHPKSADSWVLYTKEFYEAARQCLSGDGVFVQWLPLHNLTAAECKIILKTFQSVFPHTSMWLTQAFDEMGRHMKFSLIVGTPQRLSLNTASLQKKLSDPAVQKDLFPWNLNHPIGILDNFLCGEDKIRQWTKDVPINTDNLPFSYYTTRYSRGEKYSLEAFLPLLESIWPYLQLSGSSEEKAHLKDELALRLQSKRLIYQNRFQEAFALLPQDKKVIKEKDNIQMSIRYLKELRNYYPDDSRRLLWLARGLKSLLTIEGSGKPEDFADVEDMLKRAAQARPFSAEIHLELADFFLQKREKDQAAAEYRQVIKIEPDSFVARAMLANILSQTGDTAEALVHFRQALKINPENPRILSNFAALLIRLGQTAEAVEHLLHALVLSPEDADIHNNLGSALLGQGKIEEAISHFEEALKLTPDDWQARANLANALAQKREFTKAIPLFSEVQRVHPEDSQNRYSYVVCLLQENRTKEAIQELREGIRLSPGSAPLFDLLARVLLSVPDPKLQDAEEALELAQKAADLTDHKNPHNLNTLAAAYAAKGKFQAAAETAKKAYQLALSMNLKDLASDIQKRLEFYRSRQ